jgi:Rap1a immunity proteins
MSRIAFVVGLAVVLVATAAHAGFMDGNRLYAIRASSDPLNLSECMGYVEGVADYFQWVRFERHKPECVAESVVASQVVDVVTSFLRDHPEARNNEADSLIIAAMTGACPACSQ